MSKFYDWPLRYGKANEQNGPVPRDRCAALGSFRFMLA